MEKQHRALLRLARALGPRVRKRMAAGIIARGVAFDVCWTGWSREFHMIDGYLVRIAVWTGGADSRTIGNRRTNAMRAVQYRRADLRRTAGRSSLPARVVARWADYDTAGQR
jgi:hypothetical protein